MSDEILKTLQSLEERTGKLETKIDYLVDLIKRSVIDQKRRIDINSEGSLRIGFFSRYSDCCLSPSNWTPRSTCKKCGADVSELK